MQTLNGVVRVGKNLGGARQQAGMVLLFVSLLLHSGVASATSSLNPAGLEQPGSTGKFAALSIKKLVQPHFEVANQQISLSSRPAAQVLSEETETCDSALGCYQTIQVPEPQSLVLVGSGLLSMAGLVRRKFTKQNGSLKELR
jgi:hypothetical protein